jgi:4-hydroxy-tetrahydrodipicolinate reductase
MSPPREPADGSPAGDPELGVIGTGRLAGAVLAHGRAAGLNVRALDPRRPRSWADLPADVLVDCSAPAVADRVLDLCSARRRPLVACVSNWRPEHLARLAELGRSTAVVRATNLSLGNYLQTHLVDQLAALLRAMERGGVPDAMPEAAVLERHPATKAHRTSATATALADRWRHRTGRAAADVASLRAGPPVSDHEIRLHWSTQALTIRHEVTSLDAAATGAVTAARWLLGRAPGRYGMDDVFGDLATTAGSYHLSASRNGTPRT